MEKVIESFVFFDSSSGNADSNVFSCGKGGDSMSVQVSGSAASMSIKFKGKSDYNSDTFEELVLIKLSDYSTTTEITSKGIYLIPLSGICQLKATCTTGLGNVKVFGTLLG